MEEDFAAAQTQESESHFVARLLKILRKYNTICELAFPDKTSLTVKKFQELMNAPECLRRLVLYLDFLARKNVLLEIEIQQSLTAVVPLLRYVSEREFFQNQFSVHYLSRVMERDFNAWTENEICAALRQSEFGFDFLRNRLLADEIFQFSEPYLTERFSLYFIQESKNLKFLPLQESEFQALSPEIALFVESQKTVFLSNNPRK